MKLAIARNLSIRHMDDIEDFLIRFDGERGKIVREELKNILQKRSAIFPETIFANRSLFHLAHF
jgi:hypothetical protein